MVTSDDGCAQEPDENDMLPDEAAVLPERGAVLDDVCEDDLLTGSQAADRLGIDLD